MSKSFASLLASMTVFDSWKAKLTNWSVRLRRYELQIRLATSKDMSSFCGMVMRSSTFSNNSWDSFVCFSRLWGKTTVSKSSRSARRAPRTVAARMNQKEAKNMSAWRWIAIAVLNGSAYVSLTVGTWGTGRVDVIATEYQGVCTSIGGGGIKISMDWTVF